MVDCSEIYLRTKAVVMSQQNDSNLSPGEMDPPSELAHELVELDETGDVGRARTTVNLYHHLQTLAQALQQPPPADDYFDEPECRQVVELVQGLGRRQTTHSGEPAVPAAPDLEHLGQYKLLNKMGEGGMGAVYRALHTRLEKIVAIKLLPRERVPKPDAVARFEREMKAVGQLDHPNIVSAMDAGEVDGTRYLVMECVSGIDLSQLVSRHGPIPAAEACEMIRQAALGLQAAHLRGMVHRDIKPGNLMLAVSDDGPPMVKVLDLGLAQLADGQPGGEDLTSTGQLMGTIDYMAPEQGDNLHGVDIRADIYALGATLYKLLTAQAVFSGPQYQTVTQKLLALAHDPVPPLQALRPDIPPDVVEIVHKMLAKLPDDRYATPIEVAKALEAPAAAANLYDLAEVVRDERTQDLASYSHSTASGYRSRFVETAPDHEALATPIATSKPPIRRRRPLIMALAALPLLALLGAWLLSLRTPYGEVIVEVADDVPAEVRKSLKVELSGNGEVRIAEATNRWAIDVSEGKYHVQVANDNADQLQLNQDSVRVLRDQKTLLRVSLKPALQDKRTAPDNSPSPAPTIVASPEKSSVETEPPAESKSPEELQREFKAMVAALPAEEQVAAVEKKLRELNPNIDGRVEHEILDGKVVMCMVTGRHIEQIWPVSSLVHLRTLLLYGWSNGPRMPVTDLSSIADLQLTTFSCFRTMVSDISPLRGMPLEQVSTSNSAVSDLTPLEGMKLKQASFHHSPLRDLAPLRGMPLVQLDCGNSGVSDLSPLRGMPIEELGIRNTPVSDLSPLAGMPLIKLVCDGANDVSDLSPLRGMKIETLVVDYTGVSDLTPLAGMPLVDLICGGTSVVDITPLETCPIKSLEIPFTSVTDWRPLAKMPIERLACSLPMYYEPEQESIRALTGLVGLDEMRANTAKAPTFYWARLAARQRAIAEFAEQLSPMPPEDQVSAIRKKLNELNPDYEVEFAATTEDGQLTEAAITLTRNSDDISPLRALGSLERLTITAGPGWLDLSPLNTTNLQELNFPEAMAVRNQHILTTFPMLKKINGMDAQEYLAGLVGRDSKP